MREFVCSLRRLYLSNKIKESDVTTLFRKRVISEEELNYILGKDG